MPGAMKQGDKVVILKSWHSDVLPGARGTIIRRLHHGYGILIRGYFVNAFGVKTCEKRLIFFAKTDVKKTRPPRRRKAASRGR